MTLHRYEQGKVRVYRSVGEFRLVLFGREVLSEKERLHKLPKVKEG